MQKRSDFQLVRTLMRSACNESCVRTPLTFEVDGLKDLCSRNPNIPKVYSKCAMAGFPQAIKARPLKLPPIDQTSHLLAPCKRPPKRPDDNTVSLPGLPAFKSVTVQQTDARWRYKGATKTVGDKHLC